MLRATAMTTLPETLVEAEALQFAREWLRPMRDVGDFLGEGTRRPA
jgi:hypothetical protein